MKTTTLNQTSTDISAIGLGAMPLSISGRPPEEKGIEVIHKALDMGVTLIDTADSYCKDESDKHHNERLIHKALEAYPEDTSDVVIATKGGLMRPGGDWVRNGDPEHVRSAIKKSFESLGADRAIPLWQLHAPDPEYDLEETLTPVREAVQDGIIEHVGVSNFSVDEIKEAREHVEVVSVQNQYSPWHRNPETSGVLEYCEDEEITFLPHSPLGGRRRAKDLDQFEEIAELASEKGVSEQRLVLAWLRAKSPCVVPIPGASRVESVVDSIPAVDLDLSDEEVEIIDGASTA